MTAIAHVLNAGEYQYAQTNTLDVILRSPHDDEDPRASRRFLTRIITRAILDVSMYPETDERHQSAKSWLLEKHQAVVSFEDLSCIVDMDDLQGMVMALAQEEGVHRTRVRDLKKQLYNWCENDSEEQPS